MLATRDWRKSRRNSPAGWTRLPEKQQYPEFGGPSPRVCPSLLAACWPGHPLDSRTTRGSPDCRVPPRPWPCRPHTPDAQDHKQPWITDTAGTPQHPGPLPFCAWVSFHGACPFQRNPSRCPNSPLYTDCQRAKSRRSARGRGGGGGGDEVDECGRRRRGRGRKWKRSWQNLSKPRGIYFEAISSPARRLARASLNFRIPFLSPPLPPPDPPHRTRPLTPPPTVCFNPSAEPPGASGGTLGPAAAWPRGLGNPIRLIARALFRLASST